MLAWVIRLSCKRTIYDNSKLSNIHSQHTTLSNCITLNACMFTYLYDLYNNYH